MNAVEHIVESYYRYILKCFTVTDIKVEHGSGRQIDVLAHQPSSGKFFHIECSVTHVEKWNPHSFWIAKMSEFKFCGFNKPDPKESFEPELEAPGKHRDAILAAYKAFGVQDTNQVERVLCSWTVQDPEKLPEIQETFMKKHGFKFSYLSFRDIVLPEVEKYVGTSNYDDDILRTLSLVRQMDLQQSSRPKAT